MNVYYYEDLSLVGAVGVAGFVATGAERDVVVVDGDESLPADDVDDGLVLPHEVLHFLLDEGVVLEQVLQMFLAEGEVLLEAGVLVDEVGVDAADFVAFGAGLREILGAVGDGLLHLFCMGDELLMMLLSSLYFSFSILTRLSLCLVSLRFFSFWCSSSM